MKEPLDGHDGLFTIEETMPCQPDDIAIGRYFLPDTLGKTEAEEVAARLIHVAQEAGQWVGVATSYLERMHNADMEKFRQNAEVNKHNAKEVRRVETATSRHKLISLLTFGLWDRVVAKPTPAKLHVIPVLPMSGIYLCGPQVLFLGIEILGSQGMLTREIWDADGGQDIIFTPTPKLIETVMEKWRVQPA